MYQGRYTSGSLGDIIVALLNAGKQCGYIFASGLTGLPSGYSGYVSYDSATDTTGAIPITLRDQNKFPIFGRIMLSTKVVEWNADSNTIKIDVKDYRVSVTAGNYTPITITVPSGQVIAKIPIITHCSDKPDIYAPLVQTSTRILVMSTTSQEVGITVYSLYI